VTRHAAHVAFGNTDDGRYALLCCHCGEVYTPQLPISIDMMQAAIKQYGKDHRACKAPADGPLSDVLLLQKAGLRVQSDKEDYHT